MPDGQAIDVAKPPTIVELVRERGPDYVTNWLAERAEQLHGEDLTALMREVANAEGARTVIGKCAKTIEGADATIRALESYALAAKFEMGRQLRQLEGGRRGQQKKCERTEVAEQAGISSARSSELVRLAELEEPREGETPESAKARVESVVAKLMDEGQRLSPHTVVKAAEAISSGPDYDSDAWYTPEDWTATGRRVVGRYDADGASCVVAQKTVGARVFYTAEKPVRGAAEIAAGISEAEFQLLIESWGGTGQIVDAVTSETIKPDLAIEDPAKRATAFARRANRVGRVVYPEPLAGAVWLNPPYSFPAPFVRAVVEGYIGRTLEQAHQEYAADLEREAADLDKDPKTARVWRNEAISWAAGEHGGRHAIREALILVNVATSTKVQQAALAASSGRCWASERIAFNDPSGKPHDQNRYEQVLIYLGPKSSKFVAEYSHLGEVVAIDGRSRS